MNRQGVEVGEGKKKSKVQEREREQHGGKCWLIELNCLEERTGVSAISHHHQQRQQQQQLTDCVSVCVCV